MRVEIMTQLYDFFKIIPIHFPILSPLQTGPSRSPDSVRTPPLSSFHSGTARTSPDGKKASRRYGKGIFRFCGIYDTVTLTRFQQPL